MVLPTPGPDRSTSPGGQTRSLHAISGSLAPSASCSVTDLIPLHGDNKGAVDLALNPVTGKQSKHIPIKHHAIREYVKEKQIELIRTSTNNMIADGFTKPLAQVKL
jgi:hypothetical protein